MLFGWLKRRFRNETSGTKNPRSRLLDWITGGESYAGVRINAKTAIKLSWVYSGINRISGDCAKLPIHLYRKTSGGKERDIKHPAYYIMRYKPNPELSSFYFIRACLYNAILHGNSYSYIFRDAQYRPTEIVPLSSESTHPVRVDGVLWYITRVAGQDRKLSPSNVFHVRGLASDGIMGLPLTDVAKDAMGLGIAAERYGSVFFSRNATPTGLLEYPMKLDDEVVKRIRQQWNDLHQGVDKANIAVLEKGVTFKPLALNNDVSQFLQTRKFQRQELAAILNLPSHILGDETRTGYASLEAEMQSYLESTLEPWLIAIEFECWDKLLSEDEKRSGDWWFDFLRAAMLKPSTKERHEIYSIGIQNGMYSPNECRGLENWNSREGGDIYLTPKNMDSSSKPEETKKPKATRSSKAAVEAHKKLLGATVTKLVRWESNAVIRATKKKNFIEAVEQFYEQHRERMIRDLEPVVECLAAVTGERYEVGRAVDDYCSSSFKAILDKSGQLGSEQLTSSVEEMTSDWLVTRLSLVDSLVGSHLVIGA